MTPGRDQIVLQASEAFKEALAAYATMNGTSMAQVIRESVAEHVGYDLANEPATQRTTRYASVEERKAAQLERAKTRRHIEKEIRIAVKAKDFEKAARLAEDL